jgi:cobyrinic acid a,c-diamide synthase
MDRLHTRALPRLVIAGLSGDAGKTLVSVALAVILRDRGVPVCAFKKGPDYIDAAWLTWATGHPARNLDTYLMGGDLARRSFVEHATGDGVNIIEGNRGVYDGGDARGTHSTAQLAKLLGAPVVLVVDGAKVTRTAAACVLGCQALDPDVRFAGVILNRVAGSRHERVLREAIEATCEVPVLGAIPRSDARLLPGRHLGLVTPEEHPETAELGRQLRVAAQSLDVDRLLAMARQAPMMEGPALDGPVPRGEPESLVLPARIGFLLDSAFTFYYPENLEALECAGARLVPISALTSAEVPADLDALYIGGGFPETHAAALASNAPFLSSLRRAAERGLPVYAECGGLMLLSRAFWWQQRKYPMAGVLPFEVEMLATPHGHGYTQLVVDGPNPFFAEGTALKGHEFHYSRALAGPDRVPTACAVVRGTGCFAGRDAVVVHQTLASYTHLHALATPQWAAGVMGAARRFSGSR